MQSENKYPIQFPPAPQPDIVRACQKDDYFRKTLYEQYFDLAQYYLGPRRVLVLKDEIKMITDLCYYGLSTLLGRPTLGEEYCDLTQVRGDNVNLLPLHNRILLLIYQILIPYAYNKTINHLNKISQQPSGNRSNSYIYRFISDKNLEKLAKWSPTIKNLIEIAQRVHLSIFYLYGSFYHISKRMLNVRYILNRNIDESRISYEALGILICVQLALSFLFWIRDKAKKSEVQNNTQSQSPEQQKWTTSNGTCSLCLSKRNNTTATSCGHLFCWGCIVEWCNNKPECPLCRRPQKNNELIPVYNFN